MKFLAHIFLFLAFILVMVGAVQGQMMEEPEADGKMAEEIDEMMKEAADEAEHSERKMGRRFRGGYGYGYGYPYYGYGYGYPSYYGYGYPSYYGWGHRRWGRW
ncbi:hypothetical protein BESB_031110 [Besnoitia besnoiti]|uniref:Transmembrane protein n=1 Tax=Besnoitia besnoiti TaxID=94643 RepID=A0A2A9M6H6_BESBE|nr:hypothetical protein BESB_031110 [Besnoitia besnoiti]PFH31237.1 hypothetical protein BESB_031110 [Besnoitia besnoiti]